MQILVLTYNGNKTAAKKNQDIKLANAIIVQLSFKLEHVLI